MIAASSCVFARARSRRLLRSARSCLRRSTASWSRGVCRVFLDALDGLRVTEALEADPLELRLELLHALLARAHLAAELLQLVAQVLQPGRFGVNGGYVGSEQ